MTADEFIAEFGLDKAKGILLNAPDWAKAIDVRHARKRFALNKTVNTYFEDSVTQMKKLMINTEDCLSLENLSNAVGKLRP